MYIGKDSPGICLGHVLQHMSCTCMSRGSAHCPSYHRIQAIQSHYIECVSISYHFLDILNYQFTARYLDKVDNIM